MAQLQPNGNPADLAMAAELQRALLPDQAPATLSNYVIAARNRMCGGVGGDFYDFLTLNEDQVAVLIGDVIGHGVPAALMMAQIMGYLRSRSAARGRPGEIVAALNDMLLELGGRTGSLTPCSLFYAVLDGPSDICFFVNAGHPRPLLLDRTRGSLHHLGSHDLLLGVEPMEPVQMCHTFAAGQRLVLYTDGLTDAVNPAGEFYELPRLRRLLARQSGLAPQAVAEGVFGDTQQFAAGRDQQDDQTMVVVDRL
jgi:sigma-B regulation protein RsbU (phosphoserine phosphatase)